VSRENVEVVRAAYRSFNRTHELDLDAFHPNIEWQTRDDLPDSGTHRGYAGVTQHVSSWVEAFEGLRVDPEELIDADDLVVAVVRLHGRVRDSGHDVEMEETHVWRLLDGKATEVREYQTRAEALKAVGLSE
jgi:uncharacterized protein